MLQLKTLTRAQGANQALLAQDVVPVGCRLTFADEPILVSGFRKMVRELAYDVAEMALTTYITAKEHGVGFTALPIFLVRDFHVGATQVRRDGSIRTATDLSGRRVGVNRGYTVTTGVWARADLAERGLNLDSVTWLVSGEEHVASYRPPKNVVRTPEGRELVDLLISGDVDAVVGAGIDHPEVIPLVPDPEKVGLQTLRCGGIFPINHLVVVRDEILEERPDVAAALFDAFTEAKRQYVEQLDAGLASTAQDHLLARVMAVTGADPLPYGLTQNSDVLDALLQHARDQHILTRSHSVTELFAEGTLSLAG